MSEDFEESKNYDDLLSYRFERFDTELANYLIKKTTRFFEYFIENYLGHRIYGSEKKFNSKMVTDYKTTKKDLYEISTSKFGIFYFSVLVFVIGLTRKVIQYWQTPAPFKIPIAPAPQTLPKLYLRMLREIFLFESLFKANRWTWFFGWIFHFGLVLLFFRHLVYFWPGELPEILLHSSPLRFAAFPLMLGLLGLLGRRVIVDRVRYISSPSDYLMLILLIAIEFMIKEFTQPILKLFGREI